MASARGRIAEFWDELAAAWLAGGDPLPEPLPRWYASYEGHGDGQVTGVNGRNRYAWSRLRFAREWLQDQELAADQLLTLELYPWHSARVTAPIAPPADIIEDFVWRPLADIQVELVFAFGKPWLGMCNTLGLQEVGRWGPDGVDLGSPVASRAAVAFALPSGQWVIVSWQSGYAGPPGSADTLRLRERIIQARAGMRRDSRPDP